MMTIKPRWNLEDKEFWMEAFITILPSVLGDTPNYDDNDKIINTRVFEERLLDRVVMCATASDKVLREMQFRFWDNDKKILEEKVRFAGKARGKRGGNSSGSRNPRIRA